MVAYSYSDFDRGGKIMSDKEKLPGEEENLNVDDLSIPDVPDAVQSLFEIKKSITPESIDKNKSEEKK